MSATHFVHTPIIVPNTSPPPIKISRHEEDQLIKFFESLAPLLVALVELEAAPAVEVIVTKLREEELVEEAAEVEVTNDVAVLVLWIVVLVVLVLVFVPVVVVEVEREVDVEANVVAESEVESEVEEVTAEDTDVDEAVDEDGMVVISLVKEEDVPVRDEAPVEVDEVTEGKVVDIEGVLLVAELGIVLVVILT